MRSNLYISCWYEGSNESNAMWELYAGKAGIAVRTTCGRLMGCLRDQDHLWVGRMKYIDYSLEPIPTGNSLSPFFHKRKEFEHEREVRAVIQYYEGERFYHEEPIPEECGLCVKVDVGNLITEIVMAPGTQNWVLSTVRALGKRYGLDVPVRLSTLEDSPQFLGRLP